MSPSREKDVCVERNEKERGAHKVQVSVSSGRSVGRMAEGAGELVTAE